MRIDGAIESTIFVCVRCGAGVDNEAVKAEFPRTIRVAAASEMYLSLLKEQPYFSFCPRNLLQEMADCLELQVKRCGVVEIHMFVVARVICLIIFLEFIVMCCLCRS